MINIIAKVYLIQAVAPRFLPQIDNFQKGIYTGPTPTLYAHQCLYRLQNPCPCPSPSMQAKYVPDR